MGEFMVVEVTSGERQGEVTTGGMVGPKPIESSEVTFGSSWTGRGHL